MASQEKTSNLLSILGSQRRRDALEILRAATLPMPMDALARAVVARERDEPETAVDDADVDSCLEALYHKHVPKMAAAGVVEVDWEQLTVTDVAPVATTV